MNIQEMRSHKEVESLVKDLYKILETARVMKVCLCEKCVRLGLTDKKVADALNAMRTQYETLLWVLQSPSSLFDDEAVELIAEIAAHPGALLTKPEDELEFDINGNG